MAYAMYLRKSRADEELGYENTLERHEEMLRNLALRLESTSMKRTSSARLYRVRA